MALKDWKKARGKGREKSGDYFMTWKNQKGWEIIIRQIKKETPDYFVIINKDVYYKKANITQAEFIDSKRFKTKSQALKFTKAYMRKH